VPQSPGIQMR